MSDKKKLCKDCKHVFDTTDFNYSLGRAVEKSADLWKCELGCETSIVDGVTLEPRPGDYKYCGIRRMPHCACKPEALQWEPLEESAP